VDRLDAVSPDEFIHASRVIERAIAAQAFPAAVVEVGDASRSLWRQAFGRLSFDLDSQLTTADTIFDLASLTKVLATTPIVMQQLERGRLELNDHVSVRLPTWRGADRASITIADLLAHCSGLPAYLPLFRDHSGRVAFEQAICTTPLEYAPRSKSVYSDLGFILLGFILEDRVPFAALFDAVRGQLGVVDELQFNPPAQWKAVTAPTEMDSWRGRLIVGEVHDENAAALGGAAGHAGLFGTASAVGQCARHWLQVLDGRTGAFRPGTAQMFITRRHDVPGSSRALGWDTMLPGSSCGSRISPHAFGHTGYTGTSLWIDPERAIYIALLTNRVHPSRANDAIKQVRPMVHDAVIEGLGLLRGR
jgi:CubicO group peptidase (beta-lactamase class C family)